MLFESKCNFTNHFLYLLHRNLAISTSFLSIVCKEFLQVHTIEASCATSFSSNGAVPVNWHWIAPDRSFRLIPIVLRLHLVHAELTVCLNIRVWARPALIPGRNDACSISIHNFNLRPGHLIYVIQEAVVVVIARCSAELVWLKFVLLSSQAGVWSLHGQTSQFLSHIAQKVFISSLNITYFRS